MEQVKGYVMFLLERFIDIKLVKITIFDFTFYFLSVGYPKIEKNSIFLNDFPLYKRAEPTYSGPIARFVPPC